MPGTRDGTQNDQGEVDQLRREVERLQALVPTTGKVRNVEQAGAVLTAVVELLGTDPARGYARQLLTQAEQLRQLAQRQPDAGSGDFSDVAVQEHRDEIWRCLRSQT